MGNEQPNELLRQTFTGKPVPEEKAREVFAQIFQLPHLNLQKDSRYRSFFKQAFAQVDPRDEPEKSSERHRFWQMRRKRAKRHARFSAEYAMRAKHPDDFKKYSQHGLYYKKNEKGEIIPDPSLDPVVAEHENNVKKQVQERTAAQGDTSRDFAKAVVKQIFDNFKATYPTKALYYNDALIQKENNPEWIFMTPQISPDDILGSSEDEIVDDQDNQQDTSSFRPQKRSQPSFDSTKIRRPEGFDPHARPHPSMSSSKNKGLWGKMNKLNKRTGGKIPGAPNIPGLSRLGSFGKAGRIATTTARAVALFNPSSPGFWILIFLLVIILVVILISGTGGGFRPDYDDYPQPSPAPVPDTGLPPVENPLPGLTLLLNKPDPVANGQNITLTIDISYSGSQDVEILANIPQNTDYVSSNGIYDSANRLIRWNLRSSTPIDSSQSGSGGMSESIIALYQSYGFPRPSAPRTLNEGEKYRFETYLRPHAEKAAAMVGVDIGFIGMWALMENSITTYMDNCYDGNPNLNYSADFDPNTYCDGWGGNWQVGYGMHPAYEFGDLQEAMEKMHPGKTLKQVGDSVIQQSKVQDKYPPGSRIPYAPITIPSSFPNVTIQELTASAASGNPEARQNLGLIMKDDAIGAYVIAKKFKRYVDANGSLTVASRMEGWGSYYNRQKIIDHVAGIYNSGIIVNKYRFSFTVKPTAQDFRVANYTVSARFVTGGSNPQ